MLSGVQLSADCYVILSYTAIDYIALCYHTEDFLLKVKKEWFSLLLWWWWQCAWSYACVCACVTVQGYSSWRVNKGIYFEQRKLFQHGSGSVNIVQDFWENVTRMLTKEFGDAAECKLSFAELRAWNVCSYMFVPSWICWSTDTDLLPSLLWGLLTPLLLVHLQRVTYTKHSCHCYSEVFFTLPPFIHVHKHYFAYTVVRWWCLRSHQPG